MRSALTLLCLALLAALPLAAADPQEIAGQAVQDGQGLLDDVTGTVGDATADDGAAAREDDGRLGDAAGSVGRFLAGVAAALGTAVAGAASAAGSAGSGVATASADAVAALGGLAHGAAGGLGLAAGAVALAAGHALAQGLAVLAAAVAQAFAAVRDGLARVRPAWFPAPAYAGTVATAATAAAAGTGWGLWSLLRRVGLLPAALAGFSRIDDGELLRHPLRRRVFETIQANPGIHASELARVVGVGWGTITHHLDKLGKAQLVATRRVNNQKCFFEVGGRVLRNDMVVAAAARAPSAAQIAAYVQAHPMTSQKAMAHSLGISPALASFHVKKLVGLGVLDKARCGKETLLTATEGTLRLSSQAQQAPAMPMASAPALPA